MKHGTDSGYANHGCRCDECKAAYKAASYARSQRPGAKHGTEYNYVQGCRCAECREAHRVRANAYRARKRAEKEEQS